MKKHKLIAALVLPLVVFIALIFYKQAKVSMGEEVILPITGFDPRNILSGHYLIYEIDFGLESDNYCSVIDSRSADVYLCLNRDKKKGDLYRSSVNDYYNESELYNAGCDVVIKGRCRYGRFIPDGEIEKFYIPEEYAHSLDRAVRNGKGKIVLSVTRGGSAVIKDLLIDDKSWKEYKEEKK
ncbi:MAG TPA: GDYXXLXY domain-containing protein [Spirochaetota bacterium]|nr:GDYXXLXY domain-containing protein [Spirochaetota bacterium]